MSTRADLLERITRPQLLRAVGVLFAAIWVSAFLAHNLRTGRLVDEQGHVLGRDLLGFYAAGRIVDAGRGSELYDGKLPQQIQRALLAPEALPGYHYFISPAFVAALYCPLAKLPNRSAVYLHAGLMLLCFVGGMWCWRGQLRTLGPHWAVATLIGGTWLPVVQTILGGQNAALSFLLLSLAYASTVRGEQKLAGACLGLELFKPQLALPLLGLLLLRGQWATCAVATSIGVLAYVLGSLTCGWRWPLAMKAAASGFYRTEERLVNGPTHISLPEVLDYSLTQPLERRGELWAGRVVRATGLALVAAGALYLVWRWRRARRDHAQFALYWGLAVAMTLLISLHTQYYEAALLLMPVLLTLEHRLLRGGHVTSAERLALLVAYVFFPLLLLGQVSLRLRFQPWALLPLAVVGWEEWQLRVSS